MTKLVVIFESQTLLIKLKYILKEVFYLMIVADSFVKLIVDMICESKRKVCAWILGIERDAFFEVNDGIFIVPMD